MDEEAAALRALAKEKLGKLRLFPVVMAVGACDTAGIAQAREQAVKLCADSPELVTPSAWLCFIECRRDPLIGPRPPSPTSWLTPSLTIGTAFDMLGRRDASLQQDAATLAPYDFFACARHAQQQGGTLEALQQAFAAFLDYHLPAMQSAANASFHNVEAYTSAMERMAKLDPDAYITLAHNLETKGNPEATAATYLKAFKSARDRVRMANHSEWIVTYLADHQRVDEALEIANDAADAFSFRGLEAAAKLKLRLGRVDEALRHCADIAERYEDPGPFARMLMECKDRDPKYRKLVDSMVAQTFPEGMIKATFEEFKDPPTGGAEITTESPSTQSHGLKPGDVVVALDGYRVANFDQYRFVRSLKEDSAPLQLIYWNGTEYRELTATVECRKFDCVMQTYKR